VETNTLEAAVTELAIAFGGTPERRDIVNTAIATGSFKTLPVALHAADLVNTLKGEGPFTVFAPSDEAFAKLPAGTVEDLLKPENKEKLRAILTYHVVAGSAFAAPVVKTLNGRDVSITAGKKGVMVNDARVVQTGIPASNGVIHVIDTVLLPNRSDVPHSNPNS
jgi:uncharacterized surface protein with fasciclin (FAS1) repeats